MTIDTHRLSVSVKRAAEMTDLSRTSLYEEIAANRLRSFKVGRRRLIAVADLSAYIERRALLATQEGTRR